MAVYQCQPFGLNGTARHTALENLPMGTTMRCVFRLVWPAVPINDNSKTRVGTL